MQIDAKPYVSAPRPATTSRTHEILSDGRTDDIGIASTTPSRQHGSRDQRQGEEEGMNFAIHLCNIR
jgi:hypothetical protein